MHCIGIQSVGTQCTALQHPAGPWLSSRQLLVRTEEMVCPCCRTSTVWGRVHSPQNLSLTKKHSQPHHGMFYIFKSNIDRLGGFGTWWLCKDGNLTQIGNSEHSVKKAGTTLTITLYCICFTMLLQKSQYLLNCFLKYT